MLASSYSWGAGDKSLTFTIRSGVKFSNGTPLEEREGPPMRACSYSWGAGDKSLTFTIRSGVKFSNGTPLTANDVAYTFNLLKKYPALDLPGVWSVLSSVTATGADTVTMDFSAPA